jgi:hypothetical protein
VKQLGKPSSSFSWAPAIVGTAILAVAALIVFGVVEAGRRGEATWSPGNASPEASPAATATTMTVVAGRGWQETGVTVAAGQTVSVEVIDGLWTHWSGEVPANPGTGGVYYVCADFLPAEQCVEPLPDFPAGTLIGRIGRHVFGIGQSGSVVVADAGTLELRVNDGDVGLGDNAGSLTVRIVVGDSTAVATPTTTVATSSP